MYLKKSVFYVLQKLLRNLVVRNRRVWIFGSWFGKRYLDNPRFLFDYVRANNSKILPVWLTKDASVVRRVRESGGRAYLVDTKWASLWCAMAEVLLTSQDGQADIGRHANSIPFNVSLWHGMPIKKIGKDEPKPWGLTPTPDRAIACSPESQKHIAGAFDLNQAAVMITGEPRGDVLVHPTDRCCSLKRELQSGDSRRRVITYLPTFRNDECEGEKPQSFQKIAQELCSNPGVQKMLCDHNACLVIKGHFRVSQEQGDASSSIETDRVIILDQRFKHDANELLAATDILITDYSSCFFDFLLTKRPVVFFAYDLEEYMQNNRQFYYDYEEIVPGPVVKTVDDVRDALDAYLTNPEKDTDLRENQVRRFHLHRDGRASERIMRNILSAVDNADRTLN